MQHAAQAGGGVGSLAERLPVQAHGERVPARVRTPFHGGVELGGHVGEAGDRLRAVADLGLEVLPGAPPGRFQAFETLDLGVGFGFGQDAHVPGGQRGDLAVGQRGHVAADVLGVPAGGLAVDDLVDELGLAGDGLPHVGVEAALGDVPVDLHLGVLVALAQDAAFPLGHVRGPPRAVQVVQGDRDVLDVGPDSHEAGRADQDRDLAGAGGGEQLGLGLVGLGLVHEPDRAGVDAVLGELAAQVLIGVPAALAAGGAEVAEDDLEAARDGQQVPVGVVVGVVAVLVLDPGDVLRGDVEFPGLRRPQPGQPRVQRGQPAVVGDLEHVVFVGQDGVAAHGLGPAGQVAA